MEEINEQNGNKNGQQRHETQQILKKAGLHQKCEYEVDPAVKLKQ